MKSIICASLLAGVAGLWPATLAAQQLTLDEAVDRAVASAPEMVAGQATVDAARAEIRQADVRPNPTVSVEAENFVGSGWNNLKSQ